jgi:hypothetical protein
MKYFLQQLQGYFAAQKMIFLNNGKTNGSVDFNRIHVNFLDHIKPCVQKD